MPGTPSRRRNLRSRLLVAFLLFSLGPLVVTLPIAFNFADRSYREQAKSEIQRATRNADTALQALAPIVRHRLASLLGDERFTSRIHEPALLLRYVQGEESFRRVGLDALFVVTSDGRYVVNSLEYGNTSPVEPTLQHAFQKAAADEGGVRIVSADYSGKSHLFQLAGTRLEGRIFVGATEIDKRLIASFPAAPRVTFRLDSPRARPSEGESADNRDAEAPMIASIPLLPPGREWRITVTRNNDDIQSARRHLVGLFALLLVLALFVSWLTASFLAGRISHPVGELVQAFSRLSAGDLDVRVTPAEGPEEIARIGEAFNRMAKELKEGEARLKRAERIAAWQEIARRLAHEIKNPLSPIQLSMENCRKAYERKLPEFGEVFDEASRATLEEVQKLKRIVEEFSDFARLPKPALSPTDLNEVAAGVARLFAKNNRGVKLRSQLQSTIPPLNLDPDQIHRLILNVVKNAVEASPKGGHVTIGTRAEQDRVHLFVTDQGPGIPQDIKEKLFTPYVTTKTKGTGLGLAIAARIAEEHGGSLTVQSSDDGSVFRLSLPRP